ncbi:FkbM family methyltransferase [Ramlibacter sp. H39-3-26]|jgi:FkbM family methyltransferase|uniref:FkbM family methyltransferase n=1 Tax=Curvibacter soli TaxID=3031331 RepID=UPI0023DC25C9|nr:FkbM family methyltransferase [Ramlibacter sp. H39-3-26]MDF1485784.1 FkbM family methyltransferase [Ramlibacter sp. H39-3-26]
MTQYKLFDAGEFLAQWVSQSSSANATIARDFLAGHAPRYALGRNETTALLAHSVSLAGVLDDYAATEHMWNGLPLLKQDALSSDGIVINTVVVARPVSAARRLGALPTQRSIAYADLIRVLPEHFPLPQFVAQTREALQSHRAEFENLFSQLKDDESRRTLEDVLQYRLTADPAFMGSYPCRMKDQYFEPFLDFPAGGVFIDAGGYEGETSIEFSQRYPGYGGIHVFEPSPTNFHKVQASLHGMRGVTTHEVGLSDVKDTLRFSAEAGSASKISSEGGESIAVDRLDDLVPGRVDFIKMDLEGWELNALTGARESIVKHHPILAISAYHHPLDFVRIHAYVSGLRKDYDLYLRHYTEGWIETVLYFVPAKSGSGIASGQTP